MDRTDKSLTSLLRRDARLSVSELAARMNVSRATVRNRIERLVASGEIQSFTIQTREDLARSPVRGLMMLKIEGAGTERIIHQLTGNLEVTAVHSTNGKWDLIVEIGTDTLEKFDKILTDIRKLSGVSSSETNLLLNTRRQKPSPRISTI